MIVGSLRDWPEHRLVCGLFDERILEYNVDEMAQFEGSPERFPFRFSASDPLGYPETS